MKIAEGRTAESKTLYEQHIDESNRAGPEPELAGH